MFQTVVERGGASTWLTSWLHCLVRAKRLGTPLRKSLGLVSMAGVWKFLFFCCAARSLRRCPGSRVMSEYGVPESFSGGVTTLGSLAGTGRTGVGTGSSVDWSSFGSSGVCKMVAIVSSADNFLVSISAKGLAVVGFRIAVSKLVRAAVAESTDAVLGMVTCVGNHSMVLAMRSARVSMMNSR